jgi:hypothetical protein
VWIPDISPGRPRGLRADENLRRQREPLLTGTVYDEFISLDVYETVVVEVSVVLRVLESGRMNSMRHIAVAHPAGEVSKLTPPYLSPLAVSHRADTTEAA